MASFSSLSGLVHFQLSGSFHIYFFLLKGGSDPPNPNRGVQTPLPPRSLNTLICSQAMHCASIFGQKSRG